MGLTQEKAEFEPWQNSDLTSLQRRDVVDAIVEVEVMLNVVNTRIDKADDKEHIENCEQGLLSDPAVSTWLKNRIVSSRAHNPRKMIMHYQTLHDLLSAQFQEMTKQ